MDEVTDSRELTQGPGGPEGQPGAPGVVAPIVPIEPLPPIESRFLFVDVAALRAKQLRRGARVRFDPEHGVPAPHKPERVAMEEVRRGLVYYNVPPWRPSHIQGAA
jgi:DNA-directed RNA polymerase omega subunit